MLSSLLASLFFVATPSLDPLAVQVDSEPMDVGITITATQFRARSYTAVPHLFVFREMQTGRIALSTLRMGAELAFSFPPHALVDFQLEVVAFERGAWKDTGALELAALAVNDLTLLWIRSTKTRAFAWLDRDGELALLGSGTSLLPAALEPASEHSPENSLMAPAHVPVITPSGRPKGDVPPKLEDGPLPPV